MATEELIYTLNSFLQLNVSPLNSGNAGTDPRLCCLILLQRLMRIR